MKNLKDPNSTFLKRRNFLLKLVAACISLFIAGSLNAKEKTEKVINWILGDGYHPNDHNWGMGIDINKCIGCGRCANACKSENKVPPKPFFFRTWVEQYRVFEDGEIVIDSPNGAVDGFKPKSFEKTIIRNFFVPKICNQCDNPPCVQVCPVGATFITPDGVILVDTNYCIGCQYCIQACPYGARFLHPETRTAEKCTFCYHRLVIDKVPVCVEVCPTQTRIFGDVKRKASPLVRFMRMNKVSVLKSSLNTEPKVFYANLDMEVK